MPEVKLLDLSHSSEWGRFLSLLPESQRDVYYSPEYYALYQTDGDGQAFCFVYQDAGEILLYPFLLNAIAPLGYSLDREYYDIQGAYGYNGFVTSSGDAAFLSGFHDCFSSFCEQKDIVAEFTRFHPLLRNHVWASPQMKCIYSRKTVLLALTPTWEDIWQNSFSPKNRNVIKKAVKDGVTIEESEDFEMFRQLYDQTMRDVGAEDFYFFPESYYEELKRRFHRDIKLYFAMFDRSPIAGSLFFFRGEYAHYHLSGRDRRFSKIAANNVILSHAIQKAKEQGCRWFHLGGGTTGEETDPLLHFKRNFSKETGEFWFGKRVHNQPVYDSLVTQWADRYPESYGNNKFKLLGYREI